MKRYFWLIIFLVGCASISQIEKNNLELGMDTKSVKVALGRPLFITPMHILQDDKIHKTGVEVWEYRNLLEGRGTLLYFYNGELSQIEEGYLRSRFWPQPKFKYE